MLDRIAERPQRRRMLLISLENDTFSTGAWNVFSKWEATLSRKADCSTLWARREKRNSTVRLMTALLTAGYISRCIMQTLTLHDLAHFSPGRRTVHHCLTCSWAGCSCSHCGFACRLFESLRSWSRRIMTWPTYRLIIASPTNRHSVASDAERKKYILPASSSVTNVTIPFICLSRSYPNHLRRLCRRVWST